MDRYQSRGDLTFDDVRTIYAQAYRLSAGRAAAAAGADTAAGSCPTAEVVFTAREPPRGNSRGKDQSSAPAAKKEPWNRPQGVRRY